jgi:hypothetical protein
MRIKTVYSDYKPEKNKNDKKTILPFLSYFYIYQKQKH